MVFGPKSLQKNMSPESLRDSIALQRALLEESCTCKVCERLQGHRNSLFYEVTVVYQNSVNRVAS